MLPLAKKENFTNKYIKVPACISINSGEYTQNACRMLECFLPLSKTLPCFDNAVITAQFEKCADCHEKYIIDITENGKINLIYYSYISLRNAISTISQLTVWDGECFRFPIGHIEDYPVLGHRGVMLDLARGIKNFESLKNDIILAARLKSNILHLHLSDGDGSCYKLDCLPESYCIENAYSKEQILELCALAQLLALEIIPEFDMPAHSTKMLELFPNLACNTGIDNASKWTVCAGTEDVYSHYSQIIQEIADTFPGRYIHIGGDELEFANVPEVNALCYWDICPKCKKLCENEGLNNRIELYEYFIRRIHTFVKKAGRTMIMWSDQLEKNRIPNLPKDIILQFWAVLGDGRGPVEGTTMNDQLNFGYNIINSNFSDLYCDLEEYMSSAAFADWKWDKSPECNKALAKKQILGSELCAWEYGNKKMHYDRTLPPTMVITADKLWNGERLNYSDSYRKKITKAIFGAGTPGFLDISKCFGDIIPPRTAELAYYDTITAQKADFDAAIAALNEDSYCGGDGERAAKFKNFISRIANR